VILNNPCVAPIFVFIFAGRKEGHCNDNGPGGENGASANLQKLRRKQRLVMVLLAAKDE
jgi:hypothetical protein